MPITKDVSIIRGAYYIPVMVSMVVMSMIWSFILNPVNGLIPYLARQSDMNINFLGDTTWVLPVIIFVTFVTNVGQAIILYIASMIGVPKELFEAAEVDGASRFKIIFKIILPMLLPKTSLKINSLNEPKGILAWTKKPCYTDRLCFPIY